MDWSQAVGAASLCAAAAFAVKSVVDGIVRYLIARRDASIGMRPRALAQRLDGIEDSVDALAIEVERIGEHLRFIGRLGERARTTAERLAPITPRTPGSGVRLDTPH